MPYVPGGSTAAYNPRPTYQYGRAPQPAPYRGGAAGVDADFGLRDQFAQGAIGALGQRDNNRYGMDMARMQNDYSLASQRGGLATAAQIATARGDLGRSLQDYGNLRDNGIYSKQQMDTLLMDRYQQVANATRSMQSNANNMAMQYGGRGNAGLTSALSMAGQFAAGGQRGEALAGLEREQADARKMGISGYGNISQMMADLAARPIAENVVAPTGTYEYDYTNSGGSPAAAYMDTYNQWRNSEVGRDGQNNMSQPRPQAPAYTPTYPYGGGQQRPPAMTTRRYY